MPNIGPMPASRRTSASARPPVILPFGSVVCAGSAIMRGASRRRPGVIPYVCHPERSSRRERSRRTAEIGLMADRVELGLSFLRTMVRIREFEQHARIGYDGGEIPGVVHLSIGQEAVAAGVCANLERDDYVASTHRGHGHCIAKGAETSAMMAELFGKVTGTNKGKGGSMHIADF